MSNFNESIDSSTIPRFSRRSMLKAAAATTAGAALFSAPAAASDDTADFTIECIGDKVKVCLSEIRLFGGGTAAPTDLDNLQVYLGTFENVNTNTVNNRVDSGEIKPCFIDYPKPCPSPVAFPESSTNEGDEICYIFDRSEAGLEGPVSGNTSNGYPNSVVLAGVYEDSSGETQAFDSYGEVQKGRGPFIVEFDPTTCCVECESGEELLVKYEWDDEEGEFVMETGGSDSITLDPDSVVLDEDGEPQEVCFSTTYCDVDAVAKAGNEYETFDDSDGDGEICVTGLDKAISNIQFFCEAPEDPSVGNGNGRSNGRGS